MRPLTLASILLATTWLTSTSCAPDRNNDPGDGDLDSPADGDGDGDSDGDGDGDGDTDGDSDGDTDGDSDGDTDGDSDGDTDGDSDGDGDSDTDGDSDGDGDTDGDGDECLDLDGDGVCAEVDCDDSVATGSSCSGGCITFYRDADGDTFGAPDDSIEACRAPEGYQSDPLDCDDGDGEVNPLRADFCGDGVDSDCRDGDRPCPGEGDLLITEITQNPNAVDDTHGEWLEVYNATSTPIELGGLILRDEGSDTHTIEESVLVMAGDYAVLARNTEAVEGADYLYRNFTLANDNDEVILATAAGVIIAVVRYDDGATYPDPTGASMSLDPDSFDFVAAQDGANWCEATSLASTGDRGTPGAPNDLCSGRGISGVTPQRGLHVGNLEVTITGAGFAGATGVRFGSTAATSFAVDSDSTIRATSPAHDPGWVDVTVSSPGGDLTRAAAFLFTGADAAAIGWCNLQWPRTTSVAVGAPTELVFGRVLVSGITEPPGACGPGVLAEVGYGALGTNPAATHGWTWAPTTCNEACDPISCGNNDEHMTTLTIDVAGDYALATRFSTDGGVNFRYCDTGGSMPGDPYTAADQGTLAVTP